MNRKLRLVIMFPLLFLCFIQIFVLCQFDFKEAIGATKHGKEAVAIADDLKKQYLRKIFQAIFWKEHIGVKLFEPNIIKNKRNLIRSSLVINKRDVGTIIVQIVINADMLKRVKYNVDIEELGNEVNAVKRRSNNKD